VKSEVFVTASMHISHLGGSIM